MPRTAPELSPVLRALIDSRCAWQSPEEIACALSSDIQEVQHEIARLKADGYLDVSTINTTGPVVTFSPWGKAVLGYELTEHGAKHVYRWIKCRPDPDPPRRRRPRDEDLAEAVARVPDRDLDPAQAAEFVEEFEQIQARRQERRQRRGLPIRPEDVMPPAILLMGHALWPWQERDSAPRPSRLCPRCLTNVSKRKVARYACECGRGLGRWAEYTGVLVLPPAAPGEPDQLVDVAICPACKSRPFTTHQRSHFCLRESRWGWDPVMNPRRDQTQYDRQPA